MAEEQAVATIKVLRNGSYMVTGPVRLLDAAGNEMPVTSDTFFLCRCGGSENKPFCDSTHKKIGFQSVVEAPASDAQPAG